jgi:hypothetical protein
MTTQKYRNTLARSLDFPLKGGEIDSFKPGEVKALRADPEHPRVRAHLLALNLVPVEEETSSKRPASTRAAPTPRASKKTEAPAAAPSEATET